MGFLIDTNRVKLSYKAWRPTLDWTTPAGKTLKALVTALPEEHSFRITVEPFTRFQPAAAASVALCNHCPVAGSRAPGCRHAIRRFGG
jgi:hypothetical protein